MDGLVCQEGFRILYRTVHDSLTALFSPPGHVGRQDTVFRRQQWVVPLDGFGRHHI